MSLKCGIVGLPNVGKSTLFNSLSGVKAEAANYPFCTIDPNKSIIEVPDKRLDQITEFVKPKKTIPTFVEFVDIAGLVKGASKGEGLGNQFLGNIKDCSAIVHVVRCFEDPNVVHVEGSVDSLRDVEVIETELLLADLAAAEKKFTSHKKAARSGDKTQGFLRDAFEKVVAHLGEGSPVRTLALADDEKEALNDMFFLTAKPIMYLANIDEASAGLSHEELCQQNEHVKKLTEFAKKNDAKILALSAKIESELAELSSEEKIDFLNELGIDQSGLDRLIMTGYSLLNLQTYFTAGEQEVRAWTIKKNWKAPQAAGVIHTDFERGFICADVYHYNDLLEHKSPEKIKENGLLRMEGKEYIVQDGDILLFKFNV